MPWITSSLLDNRFVLDDPIIQSMKKQLTIFQPVLLKTNILSEEANYC